MTLVALIPARGGSKGIHRKNIREFFGLPLLQWSIDAALASSSVDRVIVSTDDPEIADTAMTGGAEVPFLRPAELATDTASGISSVLHALDQLSDVDDLILLQPTSPLRTSSDIDAIVDLRERLGCESAVSLTPCSKHPAWMYCLGRDHSLQPVLQMEEASCRQQLPTTYVLNGALYLASRSFFLREKAFIASETAGYVMPVERSVDIDTPLDWQWAEFLKGQEV